MGAEPARIAAVGVPTRDRADCLQRCLHSYLDNGRRHGRTPAYVVIDDSEKAETRQGQRQLLQALQSRYAVEISYAGPEERVRFAEALVRQAGLPVEAVQFGLLNVEHYPIATGCSRNALLLHSAGEALLQVDDDTVCQVASAPGAQSGLALSSKYDPTEFWFFAEGEAVPPPGSGVAEDLLAVHEVLLGKGVGECLAALEDGAGLDLTQATPGFRRRLESSGGGVRVTAAGVAGDSGMGSPVYLLTLDGPSRARLLRSERDYRHALARHQVMRAVTRSTISEGGFCMAPNLGLDHRRLLPPFMPVQRNQDGIFAALLKACCDGSYFGFLPWMVLHRSPAARRFAPEELGPSVAGLRSGQIMQALVASFTRGPDQTDAGKNLRALGRALAEWGSLARADFEEVVRLRVGRHLSRLARHLERQLQAFGGEPDFWANDVKHVLAVLREALPSRQYVVASDLREAFGSDEARGRLQGLVRRLGQLLHCWPDMVEAAQELRARGQRLAEPV